MPKYKLLQDILSKGCVEYPKHPDGPFLIGRKGLTQCKQVVATCVNLGEARDGDGIYVYLCERDFPDDCSKFGCPKCMPWEK